jgi:hypothetical protein
VNKRNELFKEWKIVHLKQSTLAWDVQMRHLVKLIDRRWNIKRFPFD